MTEQALYQAHQQVFSQANLNQNHLWQKTFNLVPFCEADIIAPKVVVCADLHLMNKKNCLILSYFIEKTPKLNLSVTNFDNKRADFLWQENCLECFIEYDGQTDYFESNLALDNRYNLYHFEKYRTPNTLPPKWANFDDIHHVLIQQYDIVHGFYSRHMGLIGDKESITKINPTVILYQHGMPIFYANRHANPPDFHDKHYWYII